MTGPLRRGGRRSPVPSPGPGDTLTPKEEAFLERVLSVCEPLYRSYAFAYGCTVASAKTGASRALARPRMQAELQRRIGRLRTVGRLAGLRRMLHLVDRAKSEYVQADVAKELAREPQQSGPGAGATFVFNIDLGGGQAAAPVIDITPAPPAGDADSEGDE